MLLVESVLIHALACVRRQTSPGCLGLLGTSCHVTRIHTVLIPFSCKTRPKLTVLLDALNANAGSYHCSGFHSGWKPTMADSGKH